MNWSILLVFLALGVIGIWVAYSFLNKAGLYLFCVIASILSITLGEADLFSLGIPVSTVILPIIYFALLTCLHKFGKDEAKNLFFTVLISLTCLFVCSFFQAAYADASYKTTYFLSWNYLGVYIAPIISFVAASTLTLFLTNKIKIKQLKNFLKLAMFIAIASCIDVIICTVLVLMGSVSFGTILLVILTKFIICALVSLGLGYFEKFLNREPKSVEATKEEPKKEEPKAPAKEETPAEEVKTPDDID